MTKEELTPSPKIGCQLMRRCKAAYVDGLDVVHTVANPRRHPRRVVATETVSRILQTGYRYESQIKSGKTSRPNTFSLLAE